MFKRNNTSSIITIALMFPLVLLFQNCGSASSSNGSGEMSKREAYNSANSNNLGYSSVGSGGGGSGSGGTFSTLPGGTSGGSSSGGSSSGGGTGTTPTIKTDGTNCLAGDYGIDSQVYNTWGGDDFSVGQMRKYLPLINRAILGSNPATTLTFPDELHSETTTFNCEVSFNKLRKFFPSRYFSQHYDCSKNNGNFTTMQCRSGQWFVAASSCKCDYVPPVLNGGGND